MRIKKIELIGFKSFKDRTVIQFDAGITGIVGPNGCGKSNIVDALVWVMGDMSAKDLRATAMTDVIFAGAENYAPLGMAEVSLTLENDGGPFPAQYITHSEIMVTRRLHRNGDSEYYINKEPARLRDIQEVFMDTGAGAKGFSIIQQGMIGKIITSKPEERRHLIEEAAGITKFKARKKESQRKLQATDQNLLRLQDIIGELKRQIDSLQRQAQRAERYRQIKIQIEDLDLTLTSKQYFELATAAEEAKNIYQSAQDAETEGESQLSTLQADVEKMRLELLEREKVLEITQQNHAENQSVVQKQQMEIQELRFEIETARRNEQMTGNLLQEQTARLELLQRDQARYEEEREGVAEEAEELQKLFIERKAYFSELQSRVQSLDETLTTKRRELFAIGQTLSTVEAKLQGLNSQLEDIQVKRENESLVLHELKEKQSEFEKRKTRLQNDFEKERQLHMDLSSDVQTFDANKKMLQDQIYNKRSEVDEFKDSLNQVASRLYGLENLHSNFEGFAEGVKNVMLWQRAREKEIHADGSVSFSPVSELIEVPSEYEVAMEAALGSKLQMLMGAGTPDQVDENVLSAVDHLKQGHSGRSSFLMSPESSRVEELSAIPAQTGLVTVLKDVVRVPAAQQQVVAYLLNGVAVVDSIRTALRLRAEHPGWSFVTTDGDTLSADGVLTGGASEGADTGVLKRKREIKELSEKKSEWAGKLALATLSLKKLEEQLENVVNDFEGAQKRKIEQEMKVTELKKDLERSEQEIRNAQYACERQEKELDRIQQQFVSIDSRVQELQGSLEEQRLQKFEMDAESKALELDFMNSREGFDDLQSEVTDLQIRSAAKTQENMGLAKQCDMINSQVQQLTTQLSRMSEESEKNSTQMTDAQFQLEELKIEFENKLRTVDALKAQLSVESNEYEILKNQCRECETQMQQSQAARNERLHRMNDSQLKFEQAKMKEQYLLEQVRERYQLNLPDICEKYREVTVHVQSMESELKDLRDKLAKIGEVNLSAISEYDETAKRYEFLLKQQADLGEAKEQLRRVIDRINRICSRRFKETFDLVNDRFQKVFPVLFGGGEAHLELVEETEKSEQGIEISAKPPGKKMQSVTLMSGGEKALTAVSLVFSIFLVKPSPYCLLDEVDAPLDDANVYRFNDLVKEMAKRSQIIVVTHNKHTMEVAKKLYGVTMQERGVSTMASVNLSDI